MGAYQYQALTKTASTAKGIIEADSEKNARQLLREKGLIPTQITLIITKNNNRKQKLSAKELPLITRQLATLLAAGIPLEESLQSISDQTENTKIRDVILGVRALVMEGYSLANAMGEYPRAFPELYRATIAAGEQTGNIDHVLEKLAVYSEKQQTMQNRVQHALIYPILMMVVSFGIISFLLAFVVPKIIEVFQSSGQTLPQTTLFLIALSHFMQKDGLYVIGALTVAASVFNRSLRNPQFKLYWHRFLLRCPLINYFIRSINDARYLHTFAILFAAGVNILETMQVSSTLITNIVMREAFDQATVLVREGMSIHQALKKTKFINPLCLHLIANGEKSGELSSMMERAALQMDNEVNNLIDTALTLLEPLIILFMGAIVLFIVLSTLLPIFSMEQLVG